MNEQEKWKKAIQEGDVKSSIETREALLEMPEMRLSAEDINTIRKNFPAGLFSVLAQEFGARWGDNPDAIIIEGQSLADVYELLKTPPWDIFYSDIEKTYSYIELNLNGQIFFIFDKGKHIEETSGTDKTFQKNLRELRKRLPKAPKVLYVGSGGDTRIKKIFEHTVNLDLSSDFLVPDDIKGDAKMLPFKDCSFDLVVCKNLGARALFSEQFQSEAARVLNNGGYFFNTTTLKGDEPDVIKKVKKYEKSKLDRMFADKSFEDKADRKFKSRDRISVLRKIDPSVNINDTRGFIRKLLSKIGF